MTPAGKYSLTSTQKKQLKVPLAAESYLFIWDNVKEAEAKSYDDFITNEGYKIVHTELKPSLSQSFEYMITAFRPLT